MAERTLDNYLENSDLTVLIRKLDCAALTRLRDEAVALMHLAVASEEFDLAFMYRELALCATNRRHPQRTREIEELDELLSL